MDGWMDKKQLEAQLEKYLAELHSAEEIAAWPA